MTSMRKLVFKLGLMMIAFDSGHRRQKTKSGHASQLASWGS